MTADRNPETFDYRALLTKFIGLLQDRNAFLYLNDPTGHLTESERAELQRIAGWENEEAES